MSERANVLNERPEQLAGAHDAAQALDALLPLEHLGDQQEAALRYALAFWIMQALGRQKDTDTIVLLDKLCAAAARRSAGEFVIRLQTYRDLLEHKRQSIAAGRSGRAERLLKSQPILEALAQGPMTQAQLSERLGVTPGRVSQLLSVMEEAQLVRRERKGRESVVTRVSAAGEPASAVHRVSKDPRPMRVFQLAA